MLALAILQYTQAFSLTLGFLSLSHVRHTTNVLDVNAHRWMVPAHICCTVYPYTERNETKRNETEMVLQFWIIIFSYYFCYFNIVLLLNVAGRNMAAIMCCAHCHVPCIFSRNLICNERRFSWFKIQDSRSVSMSRVCIRMCSVLVVHFAVRSIFRFLFILFYFIFFVAHFISMCNNNTYFVLALVRTFQQKPICGARFSVLKVYVGAIWYLVSIRISRRNAWIVTQIEI